MIGRGVVDRYPSRNDVISDANVIEKKKKLS